VAVARRDARGAGGTGGAGGAERCAAVVDRRAARRDVEERRAGGADGTAGASTGGGAAPTGGWLGVRGADVRRGRERARERADGMVDLVLPASAPHRGVQSVGDAGDQCRRWRTCASNASTVVEMRRRVGSTVRGGGAGSSGRERAATMTRRGAPRRRRGRSMRFNQRARSGHMPPVSPSGRTQVGHRGSMPSHFWDKPP